MTVVGVGNAGESINEIDQHQLECYIGCNEVWCILSFPIHGGHPTIVHLAMHLENRQGTYSTAVRFLHCSEMIYLQRRYFTVN